MSESFHVDAAALSATGKVFTDMVDDVNTASTSAQNLDFDSANAGKGYHAQGTAYHAAMQKLVTTLLSPMAAKASWVGVTLETSASHYAKQESSADAGLKNSGRKA